MKIDDLSQPNPWWKDKEWASKDIDLKKRRKSQVLWIPRLMYFFNLKQDAIYTMRGPRQVGKTTLLKIMIRERLNEGIHPKRIFFWACDLIENPKELAKMLSCYLNSAREEYDERLLIFLDEVSSIKDWQKGIKHLVDAGLLQDCTVILTGSHSLDIKSASERLPGRRGNVADVLDKILLPMKFSEYAEMRSTSDNKPKRFLNLLKKVSERAKRKEVLIQLAHAKIPDELIKLSSYSNELAHLFQEYLITGGVPSAIDSYLAQGEIPSRIYNTYVTAMLGDAARWQKKDIHMGQIVQRLTECLSSQVSWQSLCKGTDLGSPQRVAECVDILQYSFVVSTIYRLDRGKGGPRFEKEKKIYFQDPFIFHALRGWASSRPFYINSREYVGNPETCSKLVESVICNHLIRLAFNMFPSSDYEYTNRLFSWENSLRKEVDFVIKLNSKYIPIEVKYQSDVKKDDLIGLQAFMEGGSSYGGIVVTKDSLKIEENLVFLPAYLFLTFI